MSEQLSRTELLLGREAMEILRNSRVAVFGIGGVGGYVAEALARSGIGAIDLIDSDRICLSNLNRQIIATRRTIGQYKVDVMQERIHEIDPDVTVYAHRCFFLPENRDEFDFTQYSYVVDAVDTVTAKIQIVLDARAAGVPVISSMGAGNKLDPSAFEVADLYETSVCPLAKVMRRELRKRKVEHLKVVYSREEPLSPVVQKENLPDAKREGACGYGENSGEERTEKQAVKRRATPGSAAFVPSVVGLIIAGEVIRDLTGRALKKVENAGKEKRN